MGYLPRQSPRLASSRRSFLHPVEVIATSMASPDIPVLGGADAVGVVPYQRWDVEDQVRLQLPGQSNDVARRVQE